MDIFSKMMFGDSRDRDKEPEENPEQPQAENEEEIDYNHVMNQLGSDHELSGSIKARI